MTTKADKRDISVLHEAGSGSGFPSSVRDASKSPWTRPPTTIPVPGARHTPGNPWTGRMKTNLQPQPRKEERRWTTGNLTAEQTVLGSMGRKVAQKELTKQHKDVYTKARSVVGLEVDEDLGEPLRHRPKSDSDSNSDPIDSIERNRPMRLRSDSTARRSNTRMEAGPSRRGLVPDGKATVRLQKKHEPKSTSATTVDLTHDDGSDNDSIESASGFDLPPSKNRRPSPPIPSGTVANAVFLWEDLGKSSPVSTRARSPTKLPTDNVPQRDLLSVKSVKNKMKPRAAAQNVPADPSPRDVLSTSSDFVRHTKRSSPKKASILAKPADIVLPLLQWAHGCEINGDSDDTTDPQFWFRYNPGTKVLKISKTAEGQAVHEFHVKQLLSSFDYTDLKRAKSDTVVIRMCTRQSPSRRSSRSSRFTPGSSGANGRLVFKFPPRHPNMQNTDAYDNLVAEWKILARDCKGKVDIVDGTGAKSMWELAVNATDTAFSSFLHSSDVSSKEKEEGLDADVETAPTSAPRRITPAIANLVAAGPSTRNRARRVAVETVPRPPVLDPDELLLIYPPSGPGAVNLTRGDMQRLEPGQYLNDNLIEFGLKLWLNDLRETEPDLAEQVHIFNSFFYKKVQVKPREEGYRSVRKWTTKFDLFKKKYIIVPINEHMHWYLAIICNPEFVLKPPPPELPKDISHIQTRKRKREEEANEMDASFGRLTTAPSPPPRPEEQEHSSDSSLQRAASEGAVEAMLTTSTVSQDHAETILAAIHANHDPLPDLQYPYSDQVDPMDVDGDHPAMASDMDVDIVSDTGASRGISPMSAGPSENDDLQTSSVWSTADDDAIVIDDASSKPVPMFVSKFFATSKKGKERSIKSTVDDVAIDIDGVSNKSMAVPTTRFYGTSNKGKERAVRDSPVDTEPRSQDEDPEQDSGEMEDAATSPAESTHIFTFDSLGSRHPGAITTLKEYLKLEAKDKKGLDPSVTSDAIGRQALVPGQPNYCDCGVYLIHFVQAFMKDPVRQSEGILNKKVKNYPLHERQRDWDADAVESLRERLLGRFVELSDKWKEQKTREQDKEGTKGKDKDKEMQHSTGEATSAAPSATVVPTVVVDSDDEIEMVVSNVKSKTTAKKAPQKGRTQSAAKGETKAARLR